MADLCKCVANHSPVPQNHAIHHILPQSWGGKTEPANMITLCPTQHECVHTCLNAYVRAGGVPDKATLAKFSAFTRILAKQAWDQRPNDKPPYTDQHGVI